MNDDDDALYRSRDYDRGAHDRHVSSLLAELSNLEARTDPTKEDGGTNRDKGAAARLALQIASNLLDAVAGWAIDHQVGLAVLERRSFPPMPIGSKRLSAKAVSEIAASDSHEAEAAGSSVYECDETLPPDIARQAFINVIAPMHGALPRRLHTDIIEGLEALEYGETLPIVEPSRARRRLQYREAKLQLRALGHVQYRTMHASKLKGAVQEEVARAYGLGADGLRTWETRLKSEDELGSVIVERELTSAANAASLTKGEAADTQYSDAALVRDGNQFQRIGAGRA